MAKTSKDAGERRTRKKRSRSKGRRRIVRKSSSASSRLGSERSEEIEGVEEQRDTVCTDKSTESKRGGGRVSDCSKKKTSGTGSSPTKEHKSDGSRKKKRVKGKAKRSRKLGPSPFPRSADDIPTLDRDKIIPMQKGYLPAQNKGWGCRFCKFYQYVGGADLDEWSGWQRDTDSDHVVKTHALPGRGNDKDPVVMFVGEAPGTAEDSQGKPFVGASGRVLTRCLTDAGIPMESVYITNAVKCRPPDNKTPSYTDAVACSAMLSYEVRKLKPKVIVPLGKVALQAVFGTRLMKITESQGNPMVSEVAGHECIVFPVFHPAYILRNDHLSGEYAETFRKLYSVIHGDMEVEEDQGSYTILRKSENCIKILRKMSKSKDVVAFDYETSTLKPYKDGSRAACISVSNDENKGYTIPLYAKADYEDAVELPPEISSIGWSLVEWKNVCRACEEFLESDAPKTAHNAKFDMNVSDSILRVVPKNIVADTMLMHYLVDETSSHSLKSLAMRYTNMGAYDNDLDKEVKKHDKRYDLVPLPILGTYAAMDAVATIRVFNCLKKELKKLGPCLEHIAYSVFVDALYTFQRMESCGALMDENFGHELHARYEAELEELLEKVVADPVVDAFIADNEEVNPKFEFNLNSPKQMVNLFIDAECEKEDMPDEPEEGFRKNYFGFKPIKFTDSKNASVDKETLKWFSDEHGCEVASIINEERLTSKLQSTYVEPLLNEAELSGGYVHGTFNLSGARTGRTSSSSPNLQNIPNKGSGAIKRLFISRFGSEGCLISADYSQIELRILASLSRDPTMLRVYLEGGDIHLQTTLSIFSDRLLEMAQGSPKKFKGLTDPKDIYERLEKVDPYEHKNMRTVAKRVNFGISYGIGAAGIIKQLRAEGVLIDYDDARAYIDRYFDVYEGVRRFIDNSHEEVAEIGYARSVYGRIRNLPEVFSDDDDLVARAYRQATNFEIQSPASDTTVTALVLVNSYLINAGLLTLPIKTVHDSLVFDAHRSEAEEVFEVLKTIMEDIPQYGPEIWGDHVDFDFLARIPIVADVEVGINERDLVSVDGRPLSELLDASKAKSDETDIDDVVDDDSHGGVVVE